MLLRNFEYVPMHMMHRDESMRLVEVAAAVTPMFGVEILNCSFVVYTGFIFLACGESFTLRHHITLDRHDEPRWAI